MRRAVLSLLILLVGYGTPDSYSAGSVPVDQLTDLTGAAHAMATLTARDNFANEFQYDVTVRNQSDTPFVAESLIVVVDGITDLAGKDATDRIEVVDADGYTQAGKPYYRIPVQGADLSPYTQSGPVTIRLRNPYYTVLFTPSFRVFGERRLPPPDSLDSLRGLIRNLVKKGLVTMEDLFSPGAQKPAPAP